MNANVTTGSATGSAALRRAGLIAKWALHLFLAAQFALGGVLKLIGAAQMVDLFAEIGVGQWLRYLIGVLELAGAAGLLVPRLAALAALGLTGLMAGAIVTNIVIGINPGVPAAFLLAAAVIVYLRRAQLRRTMSR